MATSDFLISVHPEPIAAAGLAGLTIELRAELAFPDPDHIRVTLHGPADRLAAITAALAGGSIGLPGQPPAREGASRVGDSTFDQAEPVELPRKRGRPRKQAPAA